MTDKRLTIEEFSRRSFDFLIIGGGTAGLAVAARLSEQPELQVGVLEAGPEVEGSEYVDVPGWCGKMMGSDLDWRMKTVPQPGLGGRVLDWPRGKILGGTSALNFMGWNRPSRQDLDAWMELGCTGWGWDDLLPYFKKSETFHPPNQDFQDTHKAYYDADSLGTSGPVHIAYAAEFSASHQYWHETMANLSVDTNHAPLAGSNLGAFTKVGSVDPADRTRSYSTTAYYRPVRHRPNLAVLTEALVQRIVVAQQDDGSWKATGVQLAHEKEDDTGKQARASSYSVSAAKEVILCAGSTHSPAVLERSGIGHPDVLAQRGVACRVASRQVGENLQDHIMAASVYEVDASLSTRDDWCQDVAKAQAAREAYAASRSGPLTVAASSLCYVSLEQVVSPAAWARFQARARALPLDDDDDDDDGLRDTIRRRRFAAAAEGRPALGQMEYFFDLGNSSLSFPGAHHQAGQENNNDNNKKYATVLQMLQFPFSRGSVHIRSDNPRDDPVIDPRFYEGPGGALDLDVMVECAKFGEKITLTPPLAGIVRGRGAPAAEKGDEGWRDWLVKESTTDWHPVGTCSMGGRRGIAGGVVDERLRVYGVEGLRVVDASIMPLQISAHPQATVYAIAEKGAQMILEDHEGV